MLFSYEWLQEYIDGLPAPDGLGDTVTLHSVEVEGVEQQAPDLGNVVVAEVLEAKRHPNADSLNIGLFDVGEEKPRQIVFGGAADLDPGMKIPVALAPTVLPGNFKIKKSKLRGEVSEGMCCLNSELGILNGAEEVHQFDSSVAPGTPIAEALHLGGTVIDIDNKSMTHRTDLFCHIGMARELSAVFADTATFSVPELPALPDAPSGLAITIEEPELSARYMGARLRVQVGPSPDFIQDRLRTVGIAVINNVVDITNYVMLEYGQPMHAFDAAILQGGIHVRRAQDGEKLEALDQKTHELKSDMLVIADDTKPVAIAGIIGGLASGVTTDTTEIVLEAANFDALSVRMTAKALNIRTDSGMRWEKGIPAELAELGLRRALALLQEHAHAELLSLDEQYPAQESDGQRNAIMLETTEVDRLAGATIPQSQWVPVLERIGCVVESVDNGARVTPPWYRPDLTIREDLIEEIIRLIGVNSLGTTQMTAALEVPAPHPVLQLMDELRVRTAAVGGTEVYNYSFYGADLMTAMGWASQLDESNSDHVELANPLSDDLRYLRVSLLPRLLETVRNNQNYQESAFFFETGHVYFPDREVEQFGIVVSGDMAVRRLRGITDAVLERIAVPHNWELVEQTAECPFWNMYAGGQALNLMADGSPAGTLGQVSDSVLRAFDIRQPVAFAMLSLRALAAVDRTDETIQEVSPYPALPLDWALVVSKDIPWSSVETIIREEGKDLVRTIEVFDVYRGEGVAEGHRSIGCRVTLQSATETLHMKRIEHWRNELMKRLEQELGVTLRT